MSTSSDSSAAIQVRPADNDDVFLMARWAAAMALETEGKQLHAATVAAGIQTGLDDPQRSCYFMAEIAGEPAGTLMYTFEWSDWRNAWWWWIQSVYVSPEHRRKGVYAALYGHVRALAESHVDVCGVRLYVERENISAQRTYESMGMVDSGYRVYEFDTGQ
jgi:GNAT superfamily N-acetyltransferase